MRTWRPIALLRCLAAFALAPACASSLAGTDARADTTDATDTRDVSDVSDARDVADAADVLDATDAADVSDAADATDVLDAAPRDVCWPAAVPAGDLCAPGPRCPVVVSAEARCASNGYEVSVATDDRGGADAMVNLAGSPSTPVVLSFAADGALRVEALTFARGSGLAAREPGGALAFAAGGWGDAGVGHHRQLVGRWASEAVDPTTGQSVFGYAVAADGRRAVAYTAYGGHPDLTPALLATRAPDGPWTRTVVSPRNFGRLALTFGASGRPVVAYWVVNREDSSRALFLHEVGGATQRVYTQRPGNVEAGNRIDLAPAAPRDATSPSAVVVNLPDGLHVLRPDDADAWSDERLPTSAWTPGTGCPGSDPPAACSDGVCTLRGEGMAPEAHALARTADGTLWLAYVRRHVDEEYRTRAECPSPPRCGCALTLLADRGATELVVARVGARVEERYRGRLSGFDRGDRRFPNVDGLAMDARGDRLHLVVHNGSYGIDYRYRYVVVDTTGLR